MGCASSKQPPVCRDCKTPMHRRSFSVHVHQPPEHENDTDHLVSLTSSTLGSLKLDSFYQNHRRSEANADHKTNLDDYGKRNFSIEVIEAKTWSRLIEEKISKASPQTPIRTPPGEPETIDAFELMAGLEDISPVQLHRHTRSFSFSFPSNTIRNLSDHTESELIGKNGPLWLQIAENESTSNSNATSIISDFDPDVITAFRKSTEVQQQATAGSEIEPLDVTDEIKSNGYKDKVIIYFTSLRGVRKTYEDCCYIRVILKGLGFRLDERDVSMHSGFKEELKEIMGDRFNGGGLPRVFLGNKLIGGVDEIRRMHEAGQLEKVFEGCEVVAGGGGEICEACGDVRFMLCEKCSGSCKVYQGDYDDDDDEEEYDESGFGFQRCCNCNENGLIRCPVCCD